MRFQDGAGRYELEPGLGQQIRGGWRDKKGISWGHGTGLAWNWRTFHTLEGLGKSLRLLRAVPGSRRLLGQLEQIGGGAESLFGGPSSLTEVLHSSHLSSCLTSLPGSSTSARLGQRGYLLSPPEGAGMSSSPQVDSP